VIARGPADVSESCPPRESRAQRRRRCGLPRSHQSISSSRPCISSSVRAMKSALLPALEGFCRINAHAESTLSQPRSEPQERRNPGGLACLPREAAQGPFRGLPAYRTAPRT